MIDVAHLTGAAGGQLALAFGGGCVSGYGFAIRTAYRAVKARLDKVEQAAKEEQHRCDAKIMALEMRQRELEDMLLGRRPLGFFSPIPDPNDGRRAAGLPLTEGED